VNGRPPRVAVALYLALGFLARLPSAASLAQPPNDGDAVQYETLGWKIASGAGYTSSEHLSLLFARPGEPTAMRTPGLPLFAAGPYVLFGRRPEVVRLLLVAFNAAGVGLLFALAWRRYGTRVAHLSALVWAVWPSAIVTYFASHSFCAESLAVPLLLVGLWAFDRGDGRPSALIAGLAFGWMLLARSYLIAFVPFALVLVGLFTPSRLRRLLFVLAISAIPCLAWATRNIVVMKAPVLLSTQLGNQLWLANNRGARGSWDGNWLTSPQLAQLLAEHPEIVESSEPVKSRIFTRAAWRDVRDGGLSRFAWLESRKLALFLWPRDVTYGTFWWLIPVLLAFPAGVRAASKRPHDALSLLLLAFVAGNVLVTLVFFHDSRFRFTVEPAMVLLAAVGANAAAMEIARHRRGTRYRDSMSPSTEKTRAATNNAIPM
jgi:hypothetical protein